MSKINKDFGGQCIFCKQYGAKDYSIHGSGRGRIINYFHPECYMESVRTIHTGRGEDKEDNDNEA